MATVEILNVPEGAEADVKRMSMVAIERFIRARDVKVAEAVTTKYETDIDEIRVANELSTKFAIVEEEVLSKEL